jgi:hypothetical protein
MHEKASCSQFAVARHFSVSCGSHQRCGFFVIQSLAALILQQNLRALFSPNSFVLLCHQVSVHHRVLREMGRVLVFHMPLQDFVLLQLLLLA